jgi:hypothetical protein
MLSGAFELDNLEICIKGYQSLFRPNKSPTTVTEVVVTNAQANNWLHYFIRLFFYEGRREPREKRFRLKRRLTFCLSNFVQFNYQRISRRNILFAFMKANTSQHHIDRLEVETPLQLLLQ